MELKRLDLQKMCSFEVCNFVPLTNECFANCKFLCTINLLSLVTQHSLPHYLAGIAEGTYYSRVNSGGGNAAATLGAHVKLCAAEVAAAEKQQQQRWKKHRVAHSNEQKLWAAILLVRSMQKEYSIFVVGALSNFKTEKDFFPVCMCLCVDVKSSFNSAQIA